MNGDVDRIREEIVGAWGGPVGDIHQAAAYIGLCERALREAVYARRIPSFRVGAGRAIRFRAAALAKWIHTQELVATAGLVREAARG